MKKQQLQMTIIISEEHKKPEKSEPMPHWMLFLLYLAWLRAMRPEKYSEATVLRLLIGAIALVLVVVALVAGGAPEVVAEVLKYWPLTP